MASNATSTYERNLVVVEIVGVCRLYCVNTAIATVCLHKTTKEWFRPIQVSSAMLLAPSRQLESLVPGVGSDLYCSRYSVCHSIPPGSKSFDGCPILCPGAGIESRVDLR